MTPYDLSRAVTSDTLEAALENVVRDVGPRRFALHLAKAVVLSGESGNALAEVFIDATTAPFISREEHDKAISDGEDEELKLERERDEAITEKEETIARYAAIGETTRKLVHLLREASGEDDEDAALMKRLRKENEELYARIHDLNAVGNGQVETISRLTTDVRELREKARVEPLDEVVTRRRLTYLEEKLAAHEHAFRGLASVCGAEKQKRQIQGSQSIFEAIDRKHGRSPSMKTREETQAVAREMWTSFDENQKAGVRFGMFPAEEMYAKEKEGHTAHALSCALMTCAEDDGGMAG